MVIPIDGIPFYPYFVIHDSGADRCISVCVLCDLVLYARDGRLFPRARKL